MEREECVDKPPNAKCAKLSLMRFSTPRRRDDGDLLGQVICEYAEKYSMGSESVQRMDQ